MDKNEQQLASNYDNWKQNFMNNNEKSKIPSMKAIKLVSSTALKGEPQIIQDPHLIK